MFGFSEFGRHDFEGVKKEANERLYDKSKKIDPKLIEELDKPIAIDLNAVKNFSLSALWAMNEEADW